MKRKVFKFALAVSYVVFGASVVIYVRSYHADEVVFFRSSRSGGTIPPMARPLASANEPMIRQFGSEYAHEAVKSYWSDTRYELHFSRGRMVYATVADFCRPVPPWDKQPLRLGRASLGVGHFRTRPADMKDGFGSFVSYKSSVDRGVLRVYLRTVSLGWIMLLASILPAWHAIKRARRTRPGKCAVCQYDLTGNTSGVCPECGTAVAGKVGE